jgi:histidinol phosphatase-like PHP family hydrolase
MIPMDFHVHSRYSDDGEMSVWKIAEQAVDLGLKVVGIVDHVRGTAPWFEDRMRDIEFARRCFDSQLKIFAGVEISLLNQLPRYSKFYDYTVVSVHSIPESVKIAANEKPDLILKWWTKTMTSLLRSDCGHIIGHPDRILNERHNVDNDSAKEILSLLEGSQWFVELNPKTKYPDQFLLRASHRPGLKSHLVFGSDAHTKAQFRELHASAGLVESALTRAGNEQFLRALSISQKEY